MKKLFISMLAVAAVVACSKEETIIEQAPEAIAFDTFVENATRADADTDITTANLEAFDVYASIVKADGTAGVILDREDVTRSVSEGNYTWGYTNTQYWIPGNSYTFAAIAPANHTSWSYAVTGGNAHNGVISFNNETAAANVDLIYAESDRTLSNDKLTSAPAKVAFTFNHELSRARFTFVNTIAAASNITLKIDSVRVTNAYRTGTLAVTGGATATTWAAADNTYEIAFANDSAIIPGAGTKDAEGNVLSNSETTEHHYLIPAATTYNVAFVVSVYQAGVLVGTYNRSAEFTTDADKGASYDVKAALTTMNILPEGEQFYPIEFTVTKVEDWTQFSEVNGTVNQPAVGGNN